MLSPPIRRIIFSLVASAVALPPVSATDTSVMIEKFARVGGKVVREFFALNHTSKSIPLVSLMIPKFALVSAASAGELRNRDTRCITDWSIAAPIVHAQGLATVEALSRIAATEMPGVIVKTTLCEEKGAFVYRLLVRDAGGKLTSRTVDARQPFGR
ncbi:MAG: hypothetical protein Q8L61_00060 [Hyphomicrobium sp.]|nr:hypothetical protein [Hyphomicrobium sp.]